MARVLVVHASKHGSTRDVAERVAERLRQRGHQVDIQAARGLRVSLDGYQLVVVGGALYNGRWHADAHRFLGRHRGQLDGVGQPAGVGQPVGIGHPPGVPVAVFGMGPRQDQPESWSRARAQLDRALAKRGWLHPVAVTVFGGRDPKSRRGQPPRDLRDWAAIDAWANELVWFE